ncbi:MAG: DnaB-like helicase C-terminal domain-containing protein [Methanogenium sp.]|jgi:replicative DNA helicase
MEAELLERLIIKGCYESDQYLTLVSTIFKSDYFDDPVIGKIFSDISTHFKSFGKIIPESAISQDSDKKQIFDEIKSVDFDVAKNYDYLYQETEAYLKEKAVKTAILESVDVINSKKNFGSIRLLLEDAMCKSLKVDLGLEYFKNIGDRLRRAFSNDVKRIPTYFPQLDEYINSGFPPYTLNIIISRIHGHKSSFLANVSARQVIEGHNVVILSLEMSEIMYAQRYDGIYSGLNINRMYLDKNLKIQLMKALSKKAISNKGNLFIKELPTGKASVNDFRIYLRELQMRHIEPSIVLCDYMNLMKPSYRAKMDMYSDVKEIAEELRALGLEFNCPILSVSQLNRIGSDDLPLSALDIVHISECLDPDTTYVYRFNKNTYIYENVLIKILKVGDIIKGKNGNVEIKRIFPLKYKTRYRIKTKSGKEIICSGDHKFPVEGIRKSIKTGLCVGDRFEVI